MPAILVFPLQKGHGWLGIKLQRTRDAAAAPLRRTDETQIVDEVVLPVQH